MSRILFFSALFFLGCSTAASIPKDVLPAQKMENVLYDLVQADEMVDFQSLADSTFRPLEKRRSFYDTVFALHGTTKEVFRKSLDFYQNHPDLLKPIVDSLQKRADTVSVKPDTLKHKIDTGSKTLAIPR